MHPSPFPSFHRRGHCDLGKKFCTGWSTHLNALCNIVVIFCDEINCQFIYSIMATDHSNAHFVFNLSSTSTFSGRYYFTFFLSLGSSLVDTSPFPDIIKGLYVDTGLCIVFGYPVRLVLILKILESTVQVHSVWHNI